MKWRPVFTLVIEYFTFCRFSDLQQLQAQHFRRVGPNIEICFPAAKNDQMHEGQTTMLAANGTEFCPVKVTEMYFRRLGLKFHGEGPDSRYVFCKIRKVGQTRQPTGTKPASSSVARANLQEMLREMGVRGKGVTDKSFKMLGVTKMLEAGATTGETALHGRWRTPDMPLRYKHNSANYKLMLAKMVPV